jgi:hypothetical protein
MASGTGGGGGTTDLVGSGGSTTIIPDAAPPHDVSPELLADIVRDTPSILDAGGDAIAVSITVDSPPIDAPRDKQDLVLDATSEGSRDALADTQDSADSAPEVSLDLPPETQDGVQDTPGEPLPDLPPEVGDAPLADLPPDASLNPICSNPSWAKMFNVTLAGWLSGDKEGNPFIVNTLFTSVDLGTTVGTLTSAGDSDALVIRLDPATGNPVWAKQFGDAQAQTATGVAVDKSGHVGFVGNYQGSMGVATSNLSNLGTWPYAYVGALQATDGSSLWAISANLAVDQASGPALAAIAANPGFDDFVVCGKTNIAATDLVPGAVSSGGYDIVVAKIKGIDGSILWSRQIGGTGNQGCTAAAIDDSGNVVIGGDYNGQLDFGSGAFSPAPAANSTIPWVAKLSGTDGSTIAAISPTVTGRTIGYVIGIDTDSAGNIAVAGSFTNALTFGTTSLTSAGLADAYVAKFGSSLTPIWAKNWGDAKTQIAESVAFDSSGNLTVVGQFLSSINIGPAGTVLTASSDVVLGSASDIFFARLDGTSGSSQCAVSYGDPASQAAYNVFVPRAATGANKDVAFASGGLTYNSVLNFGIVSLDTTGLTQPNFWVAKF